MKEISDALLSFCHSRSLNKHEDVDTTYFRPCVILSSGQQGTHGKSWPALFFFFFVSTHQTTVFSLYYPFNIPESRFFFLWKGSANFHTSRRLEGPVFKEDALSVHNKKKMEILANVHISDEAIRFLISHFCLLCVALTLY